VVAMTAPAEVDPFASPTPALTLVPKAAQVPLKKAKVTIDAVKFIPKALIRDYAASQHNAKLAEGATGRLDRMELTTIIAIYLLAWVEEQADAPQVQTLSGSPRQIAKWLGWERDIKGLHDALTGDRFSPYAMLRLTEGSDGVMRPPGLTEHWIIDVEPMEQADGFLRVPVWWLFQDTSDDPRVERSRDRRGLYRCPDCATWCTADKPWRRGDLALLGALMIIERADWETREPKPLAAKFLAERWGLQERYVQRLLAEAEDRGFVTGEGRRGGRAGGVLTGAGHPARRRVIMRPTDPPGDRRPSATHSTKDRCPGCASRRKNGHSRPQKPSQ
jgi:hypothetical protein